MAEGQNQWSLQFEISNKTKNITLKYHRGQSSPQLTPELPPGSSDSCEIFNDPDSLDIEQLLVFEADSFTLAIGVWASQKSDDSLSVLQLELSLDKAHLHDLDKTLRRMNCMLDAPDPDKTTVSHCWFSSKTGGLVQLNAGPCKVMALLDQEQRPVLEIELEEREPVTLDWEDLESPFCKVL